MSIVCVAITVIVDESVSAEVCYLKLMPYFFVTCGECIEATESNRGTSFADKFNALVTVFNEQNSVANRKAANVSDCRYISFSFDSKNDMH